MDRRLEATDKRLLGTGAKRLFDLIFASVGLVGTAPIVGLAALAIWIESGTPVLYRQTRVGRNNRCFGMYKLRSMRVDSDVPTSLTMIDDPRVTRVGSVLRRTRVDELPQLVNVLRGEMSVVGPRPERPEFVRRFASELPEYNHRHRVRPGITGLAQVKLGYSASAREKLVYDLDYADCHSLRRDLGILGGTITVLATRSLQDGVSPEDITRYHLDGRKREET